MQFVFAARGKVEFHFNTSEEIMDTSSEARNYNNDAKAAGCRLHKKMHVPPIFLCVCCSHWMKNMEPVITREYKGEEGSQTWLHRAGIWELSVHKNQHLVWFRI